MNRETRYDWLILAVFLAFVIGFGVWSMSGDTIDSNGTYPMTDDYEPAVN